MPTQQCPVNERDGPGESLKGPSILRRLSLQSGSHFVCRYALYAIGCATAMLIWWGLTRSPEGTLHEFRPSETMSALGRLLTTGYFWEGVLESMKRLAGGLGLAAAAGVPLGLIVGYSSRVQKLTYVPFQFLRMVSPLSWTPVAIIVLGIGSGPVYFLVAIAAIWPIIINTAAGVRSADPMCVEVVRVLGGSHLQILRFVMLRTTLPYVLVGLQLALGVGWIVLVPAEMLGVASGLGYMILDFRDVNEYGAIMAVIMVIGVLGLLLDVPLRAAISWAKWN